MKGFSRQIEKKKKISPLKLFFSFALFFKKLFGLLFGRFQVLLQQVHASEEGYVNLEE